MSALHAVQTTDDLKSGHLLDIARRRADLSDFGPTHFLEPLDILLQAMREEAQLSESGLKAQSERLINSLVSRLRKTALVTKNPEVLDEEINVGAIIVGLPRTGSTLFHRLLASSPNLTATYWWEAIYPMPLPDEPTGNPAKRIKLAEDLAAQIMSAAENFDSIHPLKATAFDEELPLIEQSFVSNMPESMMYVPSYGKWLLQADQTNAYNELIDYLKILQWQSPQRRHQQWVLKAPHHLTATDTLLRLFPKALIIMPHRSITDVMPSWYSMVGSLTEADSDAPGLRSAQAKHWTWRLNENLKDMIKARANAEHRFLDIGYRQLLTQPLAACEQAFAKAGLVFSDGDRHAFTEHLNSNKRGDRPAHNYNMADYGIDIEALEKTFGHYKKTFGAYFS